MRTERLVKSLFAMFVYFTLSSCKPNGAAQCTEDSLCDLSPNGVCLENQDSGSRWCSYPDDVCLSGIRWSDVGVGDGVGGRCVVDKTPPLVVSHAPSVDEQMVSASAIFTIAFSEKVDPGTITSETIKLESQGQPPIAVTLVSMGKDVSISPIHPLDPKKDYRISVSNAVQDLSGNHMAESVAWSFRTKEALWQPPVFLEAETIKSVVEFHVASGGGTVIAVWSFKYEADELSPSEIWVSVRKSGAWEAPVQLGTRTPGVSSPRVAIDPQGKAIAIWSAGDAGLVSSRYDGTNWATPVPFPAPVHGGTCEVSSFANGNIVAAWTVHVTDGPVGVWTSLYKPNTGWEPAVRIDRSDAASSLWMVAGDDTAAIALWQQSGRVWTSRFSGNTWSAPESIVDAEVMNVSSQLSPAHQPTAFWATDHVFTRAYADNMWEAATQLDSQSAQISPLATARGRSIAYLGGSNVLAVWATLSDTWVSSRREGQPWGPAIAIGRAMPGSFNLQVVSGPARALTMWTSQSRLVSNEYNQTAGWHGLERVDKDTSPVQNAVAVYESVSNKFIAIWMQSVDGIPSLLSSTYQ